MAHRPRWIQTQLGAWSSTTTRDQYRVPRPDYWEAHRWRDGEGTDPLLTVHLHIARWYEWLLANMRGREDLKKIGLNFAPPYHSKFGHNFPSPQPCPCFTPPEYPCQLRDQWARLVFITPLSKGPLTSVSKSEHTQYLPAHSVGIRSTPDHVRKTQLY